VWVRRWTRMSRRTASFRNWSFVSRYMSASMSRTWTASMDAMRSCRTLSKLVAAAVDVSSDCWNSRCVGSIQVPMLLCSYIKLVIPPKKKLVILVVRGKLIWSIIGILYSCQCSACRQQFHSFQIFYEKKLHYLKRNLWVWLHLRDEWFVRELVVTVRCVRTSVYMHILANCFKHHIIYHIIVSVFRFALNPVAIISTK
jgi:hypothetical protein